jgi:uncharacterized membrane protein
MRTIKLYSKEDCRLCDEARTILNTVAARVPLKIQEVDIEQNPALNKLFAEHVPVIDVGDGTRLYWPFEANDVLEALNGTSQMAAPRTIGQSSAQPTASGRTREFVIFVDKLIYQFAKHWVAVTAFFLGLYAGLPLLAPILMANGYSAPANLIYSAYRFACHQLPSRSYFIFGHQVAFCHRDTAIYATLFVATVLFALVRRRLKPLPWQGYVAFIAPMALDGITQLFGLRTSNWQLRTITGALFGLGSAWLALPYVEEAFADIRQAVNEKLHLE